MSDVMIDFGMPVVMVDTQAESRVEISTGRWEAQVGRIGLTGRISVCKLRRVWC